MLLKRFLHIALFGVPLSICAQGVSVSLSIEWRKTNAIPLLTNEGDSIPFLTITYRNETDTAFYFNCISEQDGADCPDVQPTALISYDGIPNPEEMLVRLKSAVKSTALNDFCVGDAIYPTDECEPLPYFANKMALIHYYYNLHKKREDSCFECFHKVFWDEESLAPEAFELYESYLDSSLDLGHKLDNKSIEIIRNYNAALLFLPPHGTIVQNRCLIGFWYVGGNYRFFLKDGFQPEPGAIAFIPYKSRFVPFPETLHGYTLYKGQIKAENDVSLLLNEDN